MVNQAVVTLQDSIDYVRKEIEKLQAANHPTPGSTNYYVGQLLFFSSITEAQVFITANKLKIDDEVAIITDGNYLRLGSEGSKGGSSLITTEHLPTTRYAATKGTVRLDMPVIAVDGQRNYGFAAVTGASGEGLTIQRTDSRSNNGMF